MRTRVDSFAAAPAPTLLVLLPPANARIEDLLEHGFVEEVRQRRCAVDVLLAELTAEHVMSGTAVAALRAEVIGPALQRGQKVWLAGISLGAFNALHYASAYADEVAGLALIAPYPGTGDILGEITRAGGVAAWAVDPNRSRADERQWWQWLWEQTRTARPRPVYVSFGEGDRFGRGQRLMAELVPAERVDRIDGDHSWPVWRVLWRRWLARGLLDRHPAAEANA